MCMCMISCYGYYRKCFSSVPGSQKVLFVSYLFTIKTKHKQGLIYKSREAMIGHFSCKSKSWAWKFITYLEELNWLFTRRASIIRDKSCSVHNRQEMESPIHVNNESAIYIQWSFIVIKKSEVVAFQENGTWDLLSEEAYMHENTRRNPIAMNSVAISKVFTLL